MALTEEAVYEQTCSSIRSTDDTSFKLLGLVPTLVGGSAFALLFGQYKDLQFVAPLALFGALISLGIFRWELRNIQTCNWLRERARQLEERCGWVTGGRLPDLPLSPQGIGKTGAAKFVYCVSIMGWLVVPWILAPSTPIPSWYLGAGLGVLVLTAHAVRCDVEWKQVHERVAMSDDIERLVARNAEITAAENDGALDRLDSFLAPVLAFRRRDGTVVDRTGFLVAKKGQRAMLVESVQVFGNRAIVTCVIQDGGTSTHNVRLFTRIDDDWKLLGWANEPK